MCRKGKSCGATCIDRRERCNIELGPLVSPAVKKVSLGLGSIFRRGIEAGKAERLPSVPSDMKRELAALAQPRQLDRSPGARTRTAPEVRRELANIAQAAKKGEMTLMMDDISRIMRGSLPQNLEVASAGNELGMKARVKGSGTQAGSASADTKWSRGDAKDFDGSFKIYKRIRGDKDMIDWDETVRNGKQIGEGSFGTVMRVGNVAHKRGEVGAEEANIIKRVGEAGIGPRLLGAEISTKKREGYGVDLHNGRIAMSVVPGKPLGERKASDETNGVKAADSYWKARAALHKMGIAHNDMHVENVLIDNKGVGRFVDMGLAQNFPKAALSEAMGIFTPPQGSSANRALGVTGDGDWQARGWGGTGGKLLRNGEGPRATAGGREKMAKYAPALSKVVNNKAAVLREMSRLGFTDNDIATIIDHGIRAPVTSYQQGPWAKLSDTQATKLINILYDGI
jgi:hypothetical protein